MHDVFLNISRSSGFSQLEVPQTSKLFYGMSLLFYVADYFSFVESRVMDGIGSANGKLYNATELLLQMRSANVLTWK